MMKKFIWVFVILMGLFLSSTLVALLIEDPTFNFNFDFSEKNKVTKIAVIPIFGEIGSNLGGIDLFNTQFTSPEKIKILIDNVKNDKTIDAVIFEINSPGGAVVPSQEIAQMVKNLNKTKYAVIEDVGASGAYWIASACDKIIASPLSVTGSIGVISSYLDFSGLFNKYGVNYNGLTAGELKDMGSPYKNLTAKEREIMQKKLDIIHVIFASEVARNRNISFDAIKRVATGEFYLGVEAINLGLVDNLGDKASAIEMLKKKFNSTSVEVIEYKEQKNLLDVLTKISSYYIGQGIGTALGYNGAKVSENFEIKA